jgi:hypothetical protein
VARHNRENLLKRGTFESIEGLLEAMLDTMSGPKLSEFLGTDIYPYLRQHALDQFDDNGDGEWAPLQTTTLRVKRFYGHGGEPTNKRFGKLYEYIEGAAPLVYVTDEGAAVLQYPGDMPDDKVTAKKYRAAQQGQTKPKTPARPIVKSNAEDLLFVQTRLEQFIMSLGAR